MHSSTELRSEDFEIRVEGEGVALDRLLPGFEEQSRLGIVVREEFGGVGASTLLTAAVTGFYDALRARHPDGFYRYADFYLFHVGRPRGHHHMLDVSPEHKEVVVADDPEEVLRAINDRGVTHLLVPDGEPRAAELRPETRGSAEARLRAAIAYSPSGRVERADVEVAGNERVDAYVLATLRGREWIELEAKKWGTPAEVAFLEARQEEVPATVGEEILAAREGLRRAGRTTETFRRIGVVEALDLLSPNPAADPYERWLVETPGTPGGP